MTVFLYCCPDCPKCPVHAIQMGWATLARCVAKKKEIHPFIQPAHHTEPCKISLHGGGLLRLCADFALGLMIAFLFSDCTAIKEYTCAEPTCEYI